MDQQNPTPISEVIRGRLKQTQTRYFANDNISAHMSDYERQALVDEVTTKFEGVLQSLLIDTEKDPNSQGTAKRLAKMYINEIMSGRYFPAPASTAFPNDDEEDSYKGMLVVRTEIRSMCSHHHQPVNGVAYIGIIPAAKVIGLSKYSRIAQWTARRGTLQEQLCNEISRNIRKAAECNDVAVYMKLTHGCCENRGLMAHNSATQTTVLSGEFQNADVKKEFFDNIAIQENSK